MLELRDVSKEYRSGMLGGSRKQVLQSVTLSLGRDEIVGLVGRSGCGKSTLARIAVKLTKPDGGRILLDKKDVTVMSDRKFRRFRPKIQMVFQSPETSLDPSYTIQDSLLQALRQKGLDYDLLSDEPKQLFEEISLPVDILPRYPNQVSGGEIQRAALGRALIMEPEYLLLDEPTSMLDVSVQASILSFLKQISKRNRIGMLLISHDLDVVYAMCDRVVVMEKGMIIGETKPETLLLDSEENPARILLEESM